MRMAKIFLDLKTKILLEQFVVDNDSLQIPDELLCAIVFLICIKTR